MIVFVDTIVLTNACFVARMSGRKDIP